MTTAGGPSRISIDDRDPAVSYNGSWTLGIGTGGLEFNNTYQVSRVAGSTATLSFQGDFVEVYGSVRKRNSPAGTPNPTSLYTLDDGTASTFTPVETDSNLFRVLFFEKRGLTDGNHALIIQNMVQGDFFFLDFFIVGSSGDAPKAGDNGSPTSSDTTLSKSSTLNVGTIVGIVVGTMAITLLGVLAGFYCWRKSRVRRKSAGETDAQTKSTQEVSQLLGSDSTVASRPSPPLQRQSSDLPTLIPYHLHQEDGNPSSNVGRISGKTSHSSRNVITNQRSSHVSSSQLGSVDSDFLYTPANPNAPPPYVRHTASVGR